MKQITQSLEDITSRLSPIESVWEDKVSEEILEELVYLKARLADEPRFRRSLISEFLDRNFNAYLSIFRLFLELSKDEYEGLLRQILPSGIGIKAYREDSRSFADCLVRLGVVKAINRHLSKEWAWTDVIIERLKLGRGSAIKGQKRGKYLESEVEKVIKKVFGIRYERNCNFLGLGNEEAKAEFAIPSRREPTLIFEVKAYGATGSKQTDVIGDIEKITKVKKHTTYFLFVTDGVTWKQRLSDLKKIIKFQNDGYIAKVYTLSMLPELESDLKILKNECGL